MARLDGGGRDGKGEKQPAQAREAVQARESLCGDSWTRQQGPWEQDDKRSWRVSDDETGKEWRQARDRVFANCSNRARKLKWHAKEENSAKGKTIYSDFTTPYLSPHKACTIRRREGG